MHPPQVMAALQALSTAVLQLEPVQGLQQQLVAQATGRPCHGQLTASIKRQKLGRLRVEQLLYTLLPAGGLDVYAAPAGVVLDAQALVQTALVGSALAARQQQQQQQRTAHCTAGCTADCTAG